MTAQSVILPLPSDHARFIVLRLKDLLNILMRKLKQAWLLVLNCGRNFMIKLL